MAKWQKIIPFESNKIQNEKWIYKKGENVEESYNVHVTSGKLVDILSFKNQLLQNFESYVKEKRIYRENFFNDNKKLEFVKHCPVCGNDNFQKVLNVYGGIYVRCMNCDHYFVSNRVKKDILSKLYHEDTLNQNVYTDTVVMKERIKQIYEPKARWTIEIFEHFYKTKPKSILDVGAGSGHFVHVCQKLGLNADGIEPWESGRAFCKKMFEIELMNIDFIEYLDSKANRDENMQVDYDVTTQVI